MIYSNTSLENSWIYVRDKKIRCYDGSFLKSGLSWLIEDLLKGAKIEIIINPLSFRQNTSYIESGALT